MAKEVMNFVEINGEVVDVYDMKNDDYGNFEFYMKVRASTEDGYNDREVKFRTSMTTSTGEESKKYKGFLTIYDEIKTIAENEKGDRISLRCKLVNNAYYYKGKLYESHEYLVDFANREQGNRKFEDNQAFSIYSYIEDIVEHENGLDFKVLINEYKSAKTTRGHEFVMKVMDKELVNDFKETFKKGDVAKLEGLLVDTKVKVDIPEEDLVDVKIEGIGSVRQKKIEENERRKKLREEGLFRTETILSLIGGDLPMTCEDAEGLEYPFSQDDIDEMLEGIDERMDKSKDRDMKKNPSDWMNQDIDDSRVPF